MKFWVSAKKKVKQQIGEEAIISFPHYKKQLRRYQIYRCFLWTALGLSCIALVGLSIYRIDSNIPSTIQIRADEAQSFELGVPAKAEIVSVSDQGSSNIPKGAVTIDLSQPITVKAGEMEEYRMDVKLFGFLPFKQVGIRVVQDTELVPVGVPVGIYVKTDGILVIGVGEFQGKDGSNCSPAKYILKSGDYIQRLNGEPVMEKDDFINRIEASGGAEQVLTVERNGEVFDLKVVPKQDQNGAYKLGVWVRDNAQGVGTMTYIDEAGNFGALGHGINDVDTSTIMEMDDGTLYETEIISIRKGSMGNPGEMTGMIVYSDERILGDITENSNSGIFGSCNKKAKEMMQQEAIPIAFKQEIQRGAAQILCTVDGNTRYYDVEITDLHLDHDNVNRGIELTVTDPELLAITGGIVQGMFMSYNGYNTRKTQ